MAVNVTLPRAVGSKGDPGPMGPGATDQQVATIVAPIVEAMAADKAEKDGSNVEADAFRGAIGAARPVSVDVRDFGAAADGVTDDTVAVTAALNYAGPRGLRVTTGGATCAIGSTVLVPPSGARLVNSAFKVVGALAVEMFLADTVPVFEASDCVFDTDSKAYAWVKIENVPSVAISMSTFKNAQAVATAFGLWLRDCAGTVTDCVFDGTDGTVPRHIYFQNISGSIRFVVSGCTFRNVGGTTDGDAVACENWDAENNSIVVSDCVFQNIHKRAVKAGGSNWVIRGCTFDNVGGGAGFSILSFYGRQNFTVENCTAINPTSGISYGIDIGSIDVVPDVSKILIRGVKFNLFNPVLAGGQDFIRLSSNVTEMTVEDCHVDYCRYFASVVNGRSIKRLSFARNRTTNCNNHEFSLGDSTVDDLTIRQHSSDAPAVSRVLVSSFGTVTRAVIVQCAHSKSFGITNGTRPLEAHGNTNAGIADVELIYRDGKVRGFRNAPPSSGTWLDDDQFYRLSPVAGGVAGWVRLAGAWVPSGVVGITQASSVPVAAGASPTKAEFDALVASLKAAKVMA